MRQNRNLLRSVIAFFAMFLFVIGADALWPEDGNVSFDSSAVVCSLFGTYTKYTYDDGTVEWLPSEPSSATLTAAGTASGLGWAAVELTSGSINGTAIHASKKMARVGNWGNYKLFPLIPIRRDGSSRISCSDSVSNLPTSAGTSYTGSGAGKFYTQGVRYTGAAWELKREEYTSTSSSGSWTIVHENAFRCGNTAEREGACIYNRRAIGSSTAHQKSCPTHGNYWDCDTRNAKHSRMIECPTFNGISCEYTPYRECSPHTAHAYRTQTDGDCGHTYSPSEASNHALTACPLGPGGQVCTQGGYYACTPHTPHTYGSTPPPGTTPPSPSYHPCGVHLTSVTGNHSLQSSCSSSNSNGNCTVTSFYACDNHTHTYPSPPPPPTTVACGGGCSSGAPTRTAHLVRVCSNGCGNGYWSCNSTAYYDHNQTFTCRRCGTSFTRCSNSTCTHNGRTYTYHWAQ